MTDQIKMVLNNQFYNLNSNQRTQRLKKQFGLVHLTYLLGICILFSKIKSRLKAPATFTLDDYYFRTSSEGVSNISDNNVSRIPRIIHQSYKSMESLPNDWKDTPSRWKTLHPEYEYKFWSDDDNHNLIKTYYPWFLKTYESYPAPIQRADAARYFSVLHFGGIYADMDILPTRSISPLLDRLNMEAHNNAQMIVAETYNLGLTNALFAAVPNSTVLETFVHQLPLHTKPLYGFESLNPHFGVLLSTGPTRLWIFLKNYRDKILTINPAGWGQCHQCRQKQCIPQKESFFETRKGGSWHKWDTRIMNFIFCHTHFFIWSIFCILLFIHKNFVRNKCSSKHIEIPLVANNNVPDQKKIVYSGAKEKERKWNKQANIFPSFENMNVFLHQITPQQQLSLFCATILLFVY